MSPESIRALICFLDRVLEDSTLHLLPRHVPTPDTRPYSHDMSWQDSVRQFLQPPTFNKESFSLSLHLLFDCAHDRLFSPFQVHSTLCVRQYPLQVRGGDAPRIREIEEVSILVVDREMSGEGVEAKERLARRSVELPELL